MYFLAKNTQRYFNLFYPFFDIFWEGTFGAHAPFAPKLGTLIYMSSKVLEFIGKLRK